MIDIIRNAISLHQPGLALPREYAADFAGLGCNFSKVRSKNAKQVILSLDGHRRLSWSIRES